MPPSLKKWTRARVFEFQAARPNEPARVVTAPDDLGQFDGTDYAAEVERLDGRRLDAKLVLVGTKSGRTALALSKQRYAPPTLALTAATAVAPAMALYWGVTPLLRSQGPAHTAHGDTARQCAPATRHSSPAAARVRCPEHNRRPPRRAASPVACGAPPMAAPPLSGERRARCGEALQGGPLVGVSAQARVDDVRHVSG